MSYLTSVCSASITESDELSLMLPENTAEQENNEDEDTEAEITEYLTLPQLGNILRELSVKGKNNDTLKRHIRGFKLSDTYRAVLTKYLVMLRYSCFKFIFKLS